MEKHYPDGTKEVTFDDSTYKLLLPSGIQECIYPNGTVVREEPENSQKLLLLPNGQREVHSAEYKVYKQILHYFKFLCIFHNFSASCLSRWNN